MRNGNLLSHLIYLLSMLVLILPMRNGNSIPYKIQSFLFRSYPTYEEWKQGANQPSLPDFLQAVLILPMRNGNHV